MKRIPGDWTTWLFAVLSVGGGAAVWHLHGPGAFREALGGSVWLLLEITPIIVVALLIGGYVQVLLQHDTVERWLGGESGLRGQLLATFAGAVTPGGPFAAFPLVLALYRAGAAFETAVAYLTSWSVLGVNRILIWEIPLLGWDFVVLRVLVSLPLPLLAGYTARLLVRRATLEAG